MEPCPGSSDPLGHAQREDSKDVIDLSWTTPQASSHDEENTPRSKEEQQAPDPDLVGWDENDTYNPRNWSTKYKCWITFQLGMLALSASLGSSIISPAGSTIAAYVGVSEEVTVLSISLYMYVSSSRLLRTPADPPPVSDLPLVLSSGPRPVRYGVEGGVSSLRYFAWDYSPSVLQRARMQHRSS
jgi:hypothetical protein